MLWKLLNQNSAARSEHIFGWASSNLPALAWESDEGLIWLTPPPDSDGLFPAGIVGEKELLQREFWKTAIRLTEPTMIDLTEYWSCHQEIPPSILIEALGYAVNYRALEDWKEMSNLGPHTRQFARRSNMPLTILRLYNRFSEEDQVSLDHIFAGSRMKTNYIKEIVQSFYDLTEGQKSAFIDQANELLNKERERKGADMAGILIENLRQIRYPELFQFRSRLKEAKNKLALPRALRMTIPEDFEGAGIRLECTIKSPDELEGILSELGSKGNMESLKKIFELLD